MKSKGLLKGRLQKEHKSLRMAARIYSVNYYRLVNICSGWIDPKEDEVKKIGITKKELGDLKA